MKLNHILLEYSRDITAQKWGSKLLAVANKDNTYRSYQHLGNYGPQVYQIDKDERFLSNILELIEAADPTKNKEYVQAIVKMYASGGIKMEDIRSTLADYLVKFHKLKNKKIIKPPYNDLMRYNNVQDFYKAVEQFPDVEEKPENRGAASAYYDDAELRIIVPQDETAACYYGQGTRWCTAAKNNNMYGHYAKKGQLYIIIPKKPAHTGEKYQFHFESGSFMNEQDNSVPLTDLADRYPQLRKIFQKQAIANNTFSLLATKQQLETAMAESRKEIVNFVADNLDKQIIKIVKDTRAEIGKDGIEIVEQLAEDLEDSRYDLVILVVNQVYRDITVVNDDDRLYDLIQDSCSAWSDRYAAWRDVLDEYFEEDEDAIMDISITVYGELTAAIAPGIKAAITRIVKRSLGLSESALLSTPIGKEKKFSKQVKGTDRAKKVMPGKWGTQHPFKGKLVGGA
jgi:hypothetical protein